MKTIKVDNLFELWEHLCGRLRDHPDLVPKAGGGFNFRGDFYIHLYDLMFKIKSSHVPGLYLDHLGYSPKGSKIRHLIGKYLDIDITNQWLDFIESVMKNSPDVAGDILLNTKPQGRRMMPGGCINSFIYRGAPRPSLMVISRSIEMPTKGAADMLLVSAICQLLCDRVDVKDISIRWFFSSAWTRTRTSFYYKIYKWPKKVKFANELFQQYLEKGWEKYYLTDYEFSYNANVRAKDLFLRKKAGELTSVLDKDFFYNKLKEYLE